MIKVISFSIIRSLFVTIIIAILFYSIIHDDREVEFNRLILTIYPNYQDIKVQQQPLIKFIDSTKNTNKVLYEIRYLISNLHTYDTMKCKLAKIDGRVPYIVDRNKNLNKITLKLRSLDLSSLEICKEELISNIEMIFENHRNELLASLNEQKNFYVPYQAEQEAYKIFTSLSYLINEINQDDSKNSDLLMMYEKLTQKFIDHQDLIYGLAEKKIKTFNFLKSTEYEFNKTTETNISRRDSVYIMLFFGLFIILFLLDLKFVQKISLFEFAKKILN